MTEDEVIGMQISLKPFIQGHILLLVCCVFYLAWWLLAFKPEGAIGGMRSGWLLVPAALSGILAVKRIVDGISSVGSENAAISPLKICIIGIVSYFVLLAGTWILMKRPVTTELLLIVGWTTMMAAEINALYAMGRLDANQSVGLLICFIVVAAVSMACYLVYYNLDAVKGYYDGAVPLVLVATMTGVMLAKLLKIGG